MADRSCSGRAAGADPDSLGPAPRRARLWPRDDDESRVPAQQAGGSKGAEPDRRAEGQGQGYVPKGARKDGAPARHEPRGTPGESPGHYERGQRGSTEKPQGPAQTRAGQTPTPDHAPDAWPPGFHGCQDPGKAETQ